MHNITNKPIQILIEKDGSIIEHSICVFFFSLLCFVYFLYTDNLISAYIMYILFVEDIFAI